MKRKKKNSNAVWFYISQWLWRRWAVTSMYDCKRKMLADAVLKWMGAEQSGFLHWVNQWEQSCSIDLQQEEVTPTLPAAQHYSFSPALESWDTLQHHLKHLQGASTVSGTKNRQELKAHPALPASKGRISAIAASAPGASWRNSSHGRFLSERKMTILCRHFDSTDLPRAINI